VIQGWTDIVDADLELAARAAWSKLRGGISYADSFAAALAHRDALPLITGDPEFQRVEDVIRVAWLDQLTA
jgi:predicted nucleic acid-binding protein